MPEERFVVEVREPVPDDSVEAVAAAVAERFGMDPQRLLKLLSGRTGPVTRPVLQDKARLIAGAFRDAGVTVTVRPAAGADGTAPAQGATASAAPERQEPPAAARTPSTLFLSSTRWVPSPHEEPDIAALARGGIAGAGPARRSPEEPAAPRTSERPAVAPPPATGLGLRGYLLIGFVASLALLVVLQAINGIEAGRSRSTPTVEAGMRAYNDGDFAQAHRLWMPLAQDGSAQAQYMLGYMAEQGQGRPWSNHDAAAWFRLAADQHYPQAQLALGKLYQRGMGVPRDGSRAAALFHQAAAEGYGPAQFQYALVLFHGSGVAQDFKQALRWFRAAADNGVVEAQPYVTFAGSAVPGAGRTAPGSGRAGSAEQAR